MRDCEIEHSNKCFGECLSLPPSLPPSSLPPPFLSLALALSPISLSRALSLLSLLSLALSISPSCLSPLYLPLSASLSLSLPLSLRNARRADDGRVRRERKNMRTTESFAARAAELLPKTIYKKIIYTRWQSHTDKRDTDTGTDTQRHLCNK